MTKLITKDYARKIMRSCETLTDGERVVVDNRVRLTRIKKGAVSRYALLGSPSRIRRTFATVL